MRRSILNSALAVGLVVLAGCGSDDDGGNGSASETTAESSSSASSSAPAEQEAVLAAADSNLGEIVVDGRGMTVYMFDKDTQGSGVSTCSGDCLVAWPPVIAESESPSVEGVSGEVGTITRDDGTIQVTLEGWPLYLWKDDKAPGDTTGQGVNGVWWVLTPDGTKVTATTAPVVVPGY